MISEEEKNKRKGMIIATACHAVLFILFLFLIAWRAPNPPNPKVGIVLNYGVSDVGTGDIQPETPPNENVSEEEAAPEELPEETVEEIVEETTPVEEISEPVEQQVVETPVTQEESPDVIPEVKEEPKKPEPKPEEKKEEVIEEKPRKLEAVVPKQPADGTNGKDGESKEAKAANHGDNTDEVGDKGDERGSLDARALVGNPGGGKGAALDLSGWKWDFEPKPKDTSNENGKIVFQIKVDDQGEILQIRVVEKSVSPKVVQVYKEEVQKLTFSREDFNAITPTTSTGTITFIIKSK